MFDAGAVEARLTIDTSRFNRDLDAAEARVKRFEDARHEVKITAKVDQSGLNEARLMFGRLDEAVSRDAQTRMRSSPQGSVLGALSAVLSPREAAGGQQRGLLSGLKLPGLMTTGALLSPALIPLAGAAVSGIAAVTASFGSAAVGAGLFGVMAKSVLTDTGKDATKLAALQAKLATDTTAAQRKATQQQIADLEHGWTPAYKSLVSNIGQIQDKWKALSSAVAIPALVPWLDAVNRGMQFLRPLVQPVADVFKSWGQSIDQYFKSGSGSAEVRRLATAFGLFSASQLGQIGTFITEFARGVFNLGRDLAAHHVDFGAFGQDLDKWGYAFEKWSGSAQARHDVSAFLAWMSTNGATTANLLKNTGEFLAKFAPGLSSAGTIELQLISDFLGFVNRLPASFAKPLLDTAGALLLLSKTGVLKVGIQIVGAAAKLLTGGALSIGGGAAAAAEMRAAFATGGAAAAAEIRAAFTGAVPVAGATSAVGGGAAGGAASRGILGGLTAGITRSALIAAGAAIAAGILLKVREDLASGFKGIISDIPKWFNFGTLGFITQAAQGWADLIVSKIRHSLLSWEDDVRHHIANTFDGIRHDVSHVWDLLVRDVELAALAVEKFVLIAFRDLSNGVLSVIGGLIDGLAKAFGWLPFGVGNSLKNAAKSFDGWHKHFNDGINNQIGKIGQMQDKLNGLHGKTVTVTVVGKGGEAITSSTGASGRVTVYPIRAAALGAYITQGTGPTADDVVLRASRGELVVPTHMVNAGEVDHLRGRIPGFAAGGVAGDISPLATVPQGYFSALNASVLARTLGTVNKRVSASLAAAAAAALAGAALGAGVGSYAADIQKVLRSLGLPMSLTANWLRQIQTESGGNLRAVNLTDSNARAGHPSVGLLQLIPSTFATFAGPYLHTPPLVNFGGGPVSLNPMAQIYAAIHYAMAAYGPQMGYVIGHGHGYGNGGIIPEPVLGYGLASGDMYSFGENGSEAVTPLGGRGGDGVSLADVCDQLTRLNAAIDRLIDVVPARTAGGVAKAINAQKGTEMTAARLGAR